MNQIKKSSAEKLIPFSEQVAKVKERIEQLEKIRNWLFKYPVNPDITRFKRRAIMKTIDRALNMLNEQNMCHEPDELLPAGYMDNQVKYECPDLYQEPKIFCQC